MPQITDPLQQIELMLDLIDPSRRNRVRTHVSGSLRQARLRQGIGTRDMARRIGVDPSNLSKFELGKIWSDAMATGMLEQLRASTGRDTTDGE